MFLAHFSNDLLSPLGYLLYAYLASVFRTPNNMILTREEDLMIGFIGYLLHVVLYSLKLSNVKGYPDAQASNKERSLYPYS